MSRWLILLISCLPIIAAAADHAAIGRLFLTPAERAALDIVRQNSRPPERIVTTNTVPDNDITDTVMPPVVTVQGYVKRSDGKGTVWVNGQPVQERSAVNNVEVGKLQGNTNDVKIKLPSTGQTIRLKAGQSYDPASGQLVNGSKAASLAHPPTTPSLTPPSSTSPAAPATAR